MTPTLMRVVLGLVVALALLDGVDCRPHSSTASDSALSVQNHDGDFSNRLGTHRHHHHRNNDHHHHHSRDQPESGAHAHADPVRQFLKTRIKLCGRRLAEALSAICAGKGYNSLDNDSGQSTPRYRGSVVTECCHEGCSLDDLEQYCQARKTPTSESDETAKTFDSTTNQIHQLFKVSTPASSQQPMENVEPTTASAEEREISARSTLTSQPSPRPSVEGARTLPDAEFQELLRRMIAVMECDAPCYVPQAELDDLLKHMIAVGTLPPRGGHPIIPRRHHPSAPNWLSSH